MLDLADCKGVFVDEIAPNIMALLFADDVALCSDSIGRMRDMINVLEQFCDRWKMKINLEKTKIMVFRRSGKIRKDEAFYIGEKLIEIVNCYKYLGIFFTPCSEVEPGCNNSCTTSLPSTDYVEHLQ